MKKYFVLLLCIISIMPLMAQKETIEDIYCSWSDITQFLDKENIYKEIFKDKDHPNTEKAETSAWNAFNFAFSLEGLPHGLINEIFEPAALKNINKTMGMVGNSLAALQIIKDYSSGNTLGAVSNATKTSMYYAVGKWGWKSLKIAGVGLQVFDYMLTSLGEMTVDAIHAALRDAYFTYYRGSGHRDLKTWKAIIEKLDGPIAVQKEIDGYLDNYFQLTADEINKLYSGGSWTKADAQAVKNEYLNEELLPYMKPLFLRLEEEARQNTLNKIGNEYNKIYDKITTELNSKQRYKVYLEAPEDKIPLCKAGIQVKSGGEWKLYVKGSFKDNGQRKLSFTKYSLIVNKVDSARAILRYEAAKGRQTYYQAIDLNKDKMDIYFKLAENDAPEEKAPESEEAPESEAPSRPDQAPKEVPGNEVSSSPNRAPEEAPQEIAEQVELSKEMKALFITNGLPLDVVIKKQKETASVFVGTVIHKRIPKGNVLTINKATREMTLVYKLKGPFAPELLCKGLPIAPNSYSGIIVTNDANAVNVGNFSFVLLAK